MEQLYAKVLQQRADTESQLDQVKVRAALKPWSSSRIGVQPGARVVLCGMHPRGL